MNKREVISRVLDGKRPPYVPWSLGFTHDARVKLVEAVGEKPLEALLDDHFMSFCDNLGGFTDMGNGRSRDSFGVVWDTCLSFVMVTDSTAQAWAAPRIKTMGRRYLQGTPSSLKESWVYLIGSLTVQHRFAQAYGYRGDSCP